MKNQNYSLYETEQKEKELLTLIRCSGKMDRTALLQRLGVSYPTLKKRIAALMDPNINLLSADSDKLLSVNPDAYLMAGISIGGAQCKVVLVDSAYHILPKERFDAICKRYNIFQGLNSSYDESRHAGYGFRSFNTPLTQDELITKLNSLIIDICKLSEEKSLPSILGIGIAITGAIDAKRQTIVSSYNVSYLAGQSLDSLLFPKTDRKLRENGIRVIIDHNAKALAVCEKFALYEKTNFSNEYSSRKNIASIYLGSGIGAGFIINDQLARGCSNLSGEIGHIQVPPYPNLTNAGHDIDSTCSCGRSNCLEYHIITDVFHMKREDFKHLTAENIKEKLNNLPPEERDQRYRILAYYVTWIVDLVSRSLNVGLVIFSGKITCVINEVWRYIDENNDHPYPGNDDCKRVVSNYGSLAPTIGAAILSSYKMNENIVWYDD